SYIANKPDNALSQVKDLNDVKAAINAAIAAANAKLTTTTDKTQELETRVATLEALEFAEEIEEFSTNTLNDAGSTADLGILDLSKFTLPDPSDNTKTIPKFFFNVLKAQWAFRFIYTDPQTNVVTQYNRTFTQDGSDTFTIDGTTFKIFIPAAGQPNAGKLTAQRISGVRVAANTLKVDEIFERSEGQTGSALILAIAKIELALALEIQKVDNAKMNKDFSNADKIYNNKIIKIGDGILDPNGKDGQLDIELGQLSGNRFLVGEKNGLKNSFRIDAGHGDNVVTGSVVLKGEKMEIGSNADKGKLIAGNDEAKFDEIIKTTNKLFHLLQTQAADAGKVIKVNAAGDGFELGDVAAGGGGGAGLPTRKDITATYATRK
ncbi:hypothetical protein, partial [Herbiconiux daphne]